MYAEKNTSRDVRKRIKRRKWNGRIGVWMILVAEKQKVEAIDLYPSWRVFRGETEFFF